MAEPLVRLADVSKRYGEAGTAARPVLSDVSCQIEPGRFVAVVGPSGSGKSTLLHLMAGLIAPSSGTVSWPALGPQDGLMPERVQEVFQSLSLFPPLDVVGNVALPMILAGRTAEADARAREMLARLGLAELAGKLPEELSGGQAQRVALARALVIEPDLILADEPTGQLDTATAQHLMDTLLRIAGECGMALVLATHDPRVAGRLPETWTVEHGRLTLPAREMA